MLLLVLPNKYALECFIVLSMSMKVLIDMVWKIQKDPAESGDGAREFAFASVQVRG
jgi:hypothetical protein